MRVIFIILSRPFAFPLSLASNSDETKPEHTGTFMLPVKCVHKRSFGLLAASLKKATLSKAGDLSPVCLQTEMDAVELDLKIMRKGNKNNLCDNHQHKTYSEERRSLVPRASYFSECPVHVTSSLS